MDCHIKDGQCKTAQIRLALNEQYQAYSPGGVVILGSQMFHSFRQYASAWRTWKTSS